MYHEENEVGRFYTFMFLYQYEFSCNLLDDTYNVNIKCSIVLKKSQSALFVIIENTQMSKSNT